MARRLDGSLVKRLRMQRRPEPWTQEQLASRCGVTRQAVAMIEGGGSASLETADRIAEALGVTLDFLLTDDTEPQAVSANTPTP